MTIVTICTACKHRILPVYIGTTPGGLSLFIYPVNVSYHQAFISTSMHLIKNEKPPKGLLEPSTLRRDKNGKIFDVDNDLSRIGGSLHRI